LVSELCPLSEVSKMTQSSGNLMFCVRSCEGNDKEAAAAVGPIERAVLSQRTACTSRTIYRQMGVWGEKREIYTMKT
jgi:hypothetical protein